MSRHHFRRHRVGGASRSDKFVFFALFAAVSIIGLFFLLIAFGGGCQTSVPGPTNKNFTIIHNP